MGKNDKNNAFLPNIDALIKMGINPKTGLPYKFLSNIKLKENIMTVLRVVDEQDAVNRGKWYNLPCNITSQDLERMLYYKGQLCFFYNKDLDEFFFLPFTLSAKDGNGLDVYGRYNQIRPIAYNGGATEDDGKKYTPTPIENYLSQLHLNVKYAPLIEVTEEDLYNSAVILQDYTPQYNNMNVIPRQTLNDPILNVMADCIPFMRTSLKLGTGVKGVRVQDGDQASEVMEANNAMENSALTGSAWVPITSPLEIQELTDRNGVNNSEEYMLAMQSLDNFRLSTYGIDNGGLFEKKAHELQSEADINGGPVGLVMQDKVTICQNFCNIVNSIWGLGIWYEPSETITKADINGDGLMYDRDDTSQTSGATYEGGEDNE